MEPGCGQRPNVGLHTKVPRHTAQGWEETPAPLTPGSCGNCGGRGGVLASLQQAAASQQPARSQLEEVTDGCQPRNTNWANPAVNTPPGGQGQNRGTSVPGPKGEASIFLGMEWEEATAWEGCSF